jgi:hypothetical protein
MRMPDEFRYLPVGKVSSRRPLTLVQSYKDENNAMTDTAQIEVSHA